MRDNIKLYNNDEYYSDIDLICSFVHTNTLNKYIIYTKGEKDIGNNTIIYLGKIYYKDNLQYIENVTDEQEWNSLKDIMKLMSKFSLEGEENV